MAPAWNELVDTSRNATFQQSRNFLDYHGARFREASLGFYRSGKLVAAWPAAFASASAEVVVSHPGATHGGLVLSDAVYRPSDVREIFALAFATWRDQGAQRLDYRPAPSVLTTGRSALDTYWLQQAGGQVTRADLWNVVPLVPPQRLKKRLKNNLSLARKSGVTVRRLGADDLVAFHQLLVDCLEDRHGAVPVHSLEELADLSERLGPRQALWGAFLEEALVAATWVWSYEGRVVHTQYIATSEPGRAAGAPAVLLRDVLDSARDAGHSVFSFGASTADGGRTVNEGLYLFKSGFGVGSYTHLHWSVDLGAGLAALRSDGGLDG